MIRERFRFRPQLESLDERLLPGSIHAPDLDAPSLLAPALSSAAGADAGPVFVGDFIWSFDLHPGPLPNPLPGPPPEWSLVGTSGVLSGHLSVSQVNPTKENATLTLKGFQGALTLVGQDVIDLGLGCSQIVLQTTQPTDVRVELHYGLGSSKPLWTFQANHAVAVFCDTTLIGIVQSAQIVGGRVIFMR